jgi:hypothetical protein
MFRKITPMEITMKLLTLIMLAFTFTAMANSTTVCDNIPFQDISRIVMSSHHGDVFVKEYGGASVEPIMQVTSEDIDGNFSQELSSWNGYTRILSKLDGEISIEYYDECSSDVHVLNCHQL